MGFEVSELTENLTAITDTFGFIIVKVKPKRTILIPNDVLKSTQKDYERNNFLQNLLKNNQYPFDKSDIDKVTEYYRLGTTISKVNEGISGAITFPFIDSQNGIRAIQVKNFDKTNHTTFTTFLHSIIKKFYNDKKKLPEWVISYDEQDKGSCLFGEHLLSKCPLNPVALVKLKDDNWTLYLVSDNKIIFCGWLCSMSSFSRESFHIKK